MFAFWFWLAARQDAVVVIDEKVDKILNKFRKTLNVNENSHTNWTSGNILADMRNDIDLEVDFGFARPWMVSFPSRQNYANKNEEKATPRRVKWWQTKA